LIIIFSEPFKYGCKISGGVNEKISLLHNLTENDIVFPILAPILYMYISPSLPFEEKQEGLVDQPNDVL